MGSEHLQPDRRMRCGVSTAHFNPVDLIYGLHGFPSEAVGLHLGLSTIMKITYSGIARLYPDFLFGGQSTPDGHAASFLSFSSLIGKLRVGSPGARKQKLNPAYLSVGKPPLPSFLVSGIRGQGLRAPASPPLLSWDTGSHIDFATHLLSHRQQTWAPTVSRAT